MKTKNILPGFGLALGYTIFYLSLLVLIPLSGLFVRAAELDFAQFFKIVSAPRFLSACRLTFGCAAAAAVLNTFFGLIIAWVLVRYRFPGAGILDALVDLPFALPTAVAGIALTALYSPNGWIGQIFAHAGIKIAYTPLGIIIALAFIGLPFVVRTVQPVLQDIDPEIEEAAACLGASRVLTISKVIFPELSGALLTGFALAFARGLGEYGSVVFIAGNMPGRTEILPLLIMIKLEQFDMIGAIAIAVVMLVMSFILLLVINLLQARMSRYHYA